MHPPGRLPAPVARTGQCARCPRNGEYKGSRVCTRATAASGPPTRPEWISASAGIGFPSKKPCNSSQPRSCRAAIWLWVSDLSQPETLSLRLLPVLLIVTQFISQKMTPNPGMDPTQQKVMLIMPVMLGYFFYFQPAGLVLYWLTSNLVGIAQQWLLNRGTPAPLAVTVPAAKKKNRN